LSDIETNTIDPSVASPGGILKRCREYHGISLEEAEEATKIGANYLAALEGDLIGQFASQAYLKGFLRIYSTYLGLNPDDMIRLFEKLYSSGKGQPDGKNGTDASAEKPLRKKFPLQKLAMPAVLLVLILIASALVNRTPATPARQNQTLPAAALTAAPVTQKIVSSVRQSPKVRKTEDAAIEQTRGDAPAPPQSGAQKTAAENVRGIIVRLKATQSGTVTVAIDGSTSQAYDLAVGDSIEWKADRSITLELSNSGGVEAELNGRPLKPFGPNGKPALVVLDPDGVRQ
jgi:cytoskeletal protein RodZ